MWPPNSTPLPAGRRTCGRGASPDGVHRPPDHRGEEREIAEVRGQAGFRPGDEDDPDHRENEPDSGGLAEALDPGHPGQDRDGHRG